jgi:hypothetical protein
LLNQDFVKPGFSKPVFMRGHLALPNGPRDLPHLLCMGKVDVAWANQHSRFAMRSVTGFCRIMVLRIRFFSNPSFSNQGLVHDELALPIRPRFRQSRNQFCRTSLGLQPSQKWHGRHVYPDNLPLR